MPETDLTPEEAAADTAIPLYNGNAFDPVTNPKGFDEDGHTVNLMPLANDTRIMARLARRMALFVVGLKDDVIALKSDVIGIKALTAEDASNTYQDRVATSLSVTAAAGEVTKAAGEVTKAAAEVTKAAAWAGTAENTPVEPGRFSAFHWAAKAAAWAAGVSLPAISAAQALQFLRVKADGTGYETAEVDLFGANLIFRVARTANTALAKADKGKLIDVTSGTFTQTFVSAATLGDGWWCYYRNAGTGDVTLDPSGSQTIDGLTSFIMYPGEERLIQCDGTALRSIVLQGFTKAFASSGNFIKPPGYSWFEGKVVGGGGSGARDTNSGTPLAGGTGGAGLPFKVRSADLPASVPVTVGAGGLPQNGNTSGNRGGDSSFGAVAMARGGQGGSQGTIQGNLAGISKGSTNISEVTTCGGAVGNPGFNFPDTIHGGAAGAYMSSNGVGFDGFKSIFAGDGGASTLTDAPGTGAIPGGGGGATRSSSFGSGAGGRGQVDVWGLV